MRASAMGWHCECDKNELIPYSEKNCPHCGAAMPQYIRDAVYNDVRAELRAERSREWGRHLRRFGALCRRFWPLTLVALILLGLGVLGLVAPDTHAEVTNALGGTLTGIATMVRTVLEVIGGFLRWLFTALGVVVRFLLMVLGWLWRVLKLVVGWVWTLLVLLYENMPEILGGLWQVLQWLWKGAGYILGLLWQLLQLFWECLPDILVGLWQVIQFVFGILVKLLGFLWDAICGLFSMIF